MPANPESNPISKTEARDIEIAPFQEQENEAVENITEGYFEATKIDSKSITIVDNFLVANTEEVYKKFALKWFENNEEKMKGDGRVIPSDASDEWKINMVLSSREKGGMAATAEINNPEYREMREEMDKIGILRADMKKDHVPPETPFLLLNYLQTGVEAERQEIAKLRVEGEKGNESAAIVADSKEKKLRELYLVRKELAEKTMNEDLTQNAEKLVEIELPPKEVCVQGWLAQGNSEVEARKVRELMDAEWQKYMSLPENQRIKYQKKIEQKLEVSRSEFDRQTRNEKYTPEEKEEARGKYNRELFYKGMLELTEKNGIVSDAVWGLLEQGYKPHEAKIKRSWMFGKKKIIIPKQDGSFETVPVKELSGFLKSFEESYNISIESQAKEELEVGWDQLHDEKVTAQVEKRIEGLAKSPEMAEGGVEKIYQKAKEKIVAEYIKKRVEKNPKTKEQLRVIEKRFKEKGEKRDINGFMSDVLFKKGRLVNLGEELDDNSRKEIRGFLRDWGIKTPVAVTKNISKLEYANAIKRQTGLFGLIMEIIEEAFKPKAVKKGLKRKSKPK